MIHHQYIILQIITKMISKRYIFLPNTQYWRLTIYWRDKSSMPVFWRLNFWKCLSVCVCLSVCDMISFLAGWINIYRSTFSSKSILINRRSVNMSTSYFFSSTLPASRFMFLMFNQNPPILFIFHKYNLKILFG